MDISEPLAYTPILLSVEDETYTKVSHHKAKFYDILMYPQLFKELLAGGWLNDEHCIATSLLFVNMPWELRRDLQVLAFEYLQSALVTQTSSVSQIALSAAFSALNNLLQDPRPPKMQPLFIMQSVHTKSTYHLQNTDVGIRR